MAIKEIFPGIYKEGQRLYTKNLTPGRKISIEKLYEADGIEYRSWNPYRSKMAAAILKHCCIMPIRADAHILYLGAANGTTASYFSDIAFEGMLYAVEVSFQAMKDLLKVCTHRPNIVPIMGNARKPESYEAIVENVNVLYQDIAQRDQVNIFIENMHRFDIKEGVLMVKARSIDVSLKPKHVFERVKEDLSRNFHIKETVPLTPYARDHMAIFVGDA
jgi:fibrillarin-like pre-rRNA processing protein